MSKTRLAIVLSTLAAIASLTALGGVTVTSHPGSAAQSKTSQSQDVARPSWGSPVKIARSSWSKTS